MISCFRYSFEEDEINKILKAKRNNVLKTIKFKAKDEKEYELELRTKGYFLTHNGKIVGKIQYYEKDLDIPSIAKFDLENNHQLYIHLDAISNVSNIKEYHIDRIMAITERGMSSQYLKNLAVICNFSDDDEFFLLCVMYIAFRLYGDDEDLDDYFREKLTYYDYEKEDLDNNVPFNNSTNLNFLKVVNKALNILYNLYMYETIEMNVMDLNTLYVNYFVKYTI